MKNEFEGETNLGPWHRNRAISLCLPLDNPFGGKAKLSVVVLCELWV
jgi:hypothetical protein